MKTAIVGSGGIAHTHVNELKRLGLEVAAVIGRDKEQVRDFAGQYKIPVYTDDFSAALAADIDCVHICTPPALHYEMGKRVILAGKHLLCEKPLCIDAEKARELALLAQEQKVAAAIDFNVRYYEACQTMKSLVQKQQLGRLCLIHGSYLQEFHALPEAFSWRYQEAQGGKMRAVTEIGSHYIDLVRYITGLEITAVSARLCNFTPDRYEKDGIMYVASVEGARELTVTSEDAALLSFQLSDGTVGNVVLSEVSHGRGNYLNIEIAGTGQSVWWNSEESSRLYTAKKGQGIVSKNNAFLGGFDATVGRLFADFYHSIERQEDGHTYPDFMDGFVNLAVCEAIYESSQKNSAWTAVCTER